MDEKRRNEFIRKARLRHGDKYDYSLVEYVNSQTPVKITCPIHGVFEQTPAAHVRGDNCPKCANAKRGAKMTQEEFIKHCREVHGDKYDYSKTVYNGMGKKITIICPKHGEFTMEAVRHVLSHQGCPKCVGRNLTQEDIINMFREKHGNKYDYSKVVYTRMHDKVTIICPEHGEFSQTPSKHLLGQGCPKCAAIERGAKRAITKELFIERANKIHHGKYDYSKVEIKTVLDKVKIICPVHGEFEQLAYDHLHGHGCNKCAQDIHRMIQEEFIKRAKEVHGDKYDYSLVKYINTYTPVKIICPIHGVFEQVPESHVNKKHGCPKCGKGISKAENELYEYICSLVGECNVEQRNREVLDGKEIDIYLPSLKLGIEYNGIIWHSTKYKPNQECHIQKMEKCNEQGIKLIQIFEDEYHNHKDAVLNNVKEAICLEQNLHGDCQSWKAKDIGDVIAKEIISKYSLFKYKNHCHNVGVYDTENENLCCFIQCSTEGRVFNMISFTEHDIPQAYQLGFDYLAQNHNIHNFKVISNRRWEGDENTNKFKQLGFGTQRIIEPQLRKVDKYNFEVISEGNEHFVEMWDCGYSVYQLAI